MKKQRIPSGVALLWAVLVFLGWFTTPSGAWAEVKNFHISAINVDITLNRFGDHDPFGMMYVLDEEIAAVRAQEKAALPDRVSSGLRYDPIQPLVIRANIGDTVEIRFTNHLQGARAGLHIHGLAVTPATSAGSDAGMNPATTVAPNGTITYTWRIPDQRNMEGAYVFSGLGTDMRQQMAHGLFGVLNVEPAGSTYLSTITGRPLKSGWDAIIVDPKGKDFREDTIIYHEVGDEGFDVVDVDGKALPLNDPFNEHAYRPSSRALNYRSEPFYHRQKLLADNPEILGHLDGSHNYGSYMFGDPPTPRPRGYLGDPTKRRIVHAGSERFHVDHLHGGSIRWQFDPFAPEPAELPGGPDFFGLAGPEKHPPSQTRSQRLDSQAIGPLESYTEQVEGGAGGLQRVPGEFLFHCHFGHHYVVGMWTFWRVFDTLQMGNPWQIENFPLAELPDRRGMTPGPADSTRLLGLTMPSGRTLTTGPTTATALNIHDWIKTKVPPQGNPGPERDYDATVWNWLRVEDIGQLAQLSQQDPTIPTLTLLKSLGFEPLPGKPLYLGEPETTRHWPNYMSPAAGIRLPIMFNTANARPAFPLLRPHLGRRPPFAPQRSGSPYLGDPEEGFPAEHPDSLIPPDASRRLEYVKVTIPMPVTFNQKFGITNPEAALPVLDEDKEDILTGRKPAEQLTVRANVGDGIDVIHYSEIPLETFEFFKSNLHYHFVQFDTQASDGVVTGMSYEQSVRPYTAENIRLTAEAPAGSTTITVDNAATLKVNAFIGIGFGTVRRHRNGGNLPGSLNKNGGFEWAQITAKDGNTLTLDRPLQNNHSLGQFVGFEFVRQQLYADAESGTTYFHNHVFAVPGFGLALTGALIQEPAGAQWLDPATHEPIRSGAIADILNTTVSMAPGIPAQNFREYVIHHMNAITGIGTRTGGEPAGFNMKQEPLDRRGGEPAHVFSSVTHGDPETPVLRAYVGDLAVIRLLSSSGHDMGTLHLAGHRFRQTRFDPQEAPRNTTVIGISERFDLFFTAGSVGLQAGDYLYMNTMNEKMLDAWGILRVFDTLQPDLQPIQSRFPLRTPDLTTFPQLRPTGGPPPAVFEPASVAKLKEKLELNGYRLMGGQPLEQIPVRVYNVVAIEQRIPFSPQLINRHGRVYILAEDEAAVMSGAKPLEPLVIRGNVGEIIRVNFTNGLRNVRASFHIPQLIQTRDSLGGAFGLNNDSTVLPGGSRTYWFVIDPRFEVPRSSAIVDLGDPFAGTANGLYGMFIIEPAGSTYHDPATGREVKSGANIQVRTPQGAFRDVALIFQENDPIMNRDIMPYNEDINGLAGINYRIQPFSERAAPPFPSSVLDSKIHGDPRTPVIEVAAGERVELHVTAGFGQQPHVFAINGHRFLPLNEQGPEEGMHLYARLFAPLSILDLRLEGGAGGLLRQPGDYLYRDGRNPFFEGGLWGILRVKDTPVPAPPLPPPYPFAFRILLPGELDL